MHGCTLLTFFLGKIFSIQGTIERYQKHVKGLQCNEKAMEEQDLQTKHETAELMKNIEVLETSKRRLLGEDVGLCTLEELQHLEKQLDRNVAKIRAQKNRVFNQQIQQLKEKEKFLLAENAKLAQKNGTPGQTPERSSQQNNDAASEENSQVSEVITDLFIGLPESRIKHAK
ncbi:hypothetical protein Dimus_025152 [Dionaea muscipula]